VVASAVGGIPEAMGEGGLLLPANATADEWAAAIESVLSDSAVYRQLSSAGVAHTSQARFSPDAIADAFASLARTFVSGSDGHALSAAPAH
jgi:glycosyltransferase involved in cell wall biosynthesis